MKHTQSDTSGRIGIPEPELHQAARAVGVPADYYEGRRAPPPFLPDNLLMFVRKKSIRPARGHHQHHRFVLVMNLLRRGGVVLDDVYFHLLPGQALLIFPYQYHSFHFERPDDEILWLFATFEGGRAEDLLDLRNRPVELSAAAKATALRLASAYAWNGETPRHNQALILETGLLLNELLSAAEQGGVSATTAADGDPMDMVMRVSRYVDAHMQEGVGVKEVAAHLRMSPSGVRTLFRRTLRVSLGRFLQDKRMLRAMTLLGNSDLRLAAIAARCGFSSPYALSRAFRREKKTPPREYRRRHHRESRRDPEIPPVAGAGTSSDIDTCPK